MPTKPRNRNPVPKATKDKLWKVFSAYIKKRDNYTCITCGKSATGTGMHSGHMIPDHKCDENLRYSPFNVHAQCYYCNINLGGWGERYAVRAEELYGRPAIDQLRADMKALEALDSAGWYANYWTAADYEDAIAEYSEKLADLEIPIVDIKARKEALNELTQLSQEMGLYD